jgi:hypothetical protein
VSTDTELRTVDLRVLSSALGPVQAERFVALMLREPFDYTEWQRSLWRDVDLRDLSAQAMAHRASHPQKR